MEKAVKPSAVQTATSSAKKKAKPKKTIPAAAPKDK
jgi:hypothetical protein